MNSTPWLLRRRITAPQSRLFCFSYAGGSAANYMPWHAQLAPDIEVCAVQLPGRGTRLAEPPMTSMAQVVEAIAQAVVTLSDLPFAFFGHSLGALLAFEVARYCQQRALPTPAHLFASACDAPQYRRTDRELHLLDDEALIDTLRRFNGTPSELLDDSELMGMVLPMLRADFYLAGNYTYRSGPRLAVPMTVLSGTDDEHVRLDRLEAWARETSARCSFHRFEGDHFFINDQTSAVLACVRAELAPLCLLGAVS